MDEETGYIYFGARYYDPKVSVWVSTDPYLGRYLKRLNTSIDENSYIFALYTQSNNNPINYKDADGNIVIAIPLLVGAASGAISGLLELATNENATMGSVFWAFASGFVGGAVASMGGGFTTGLVFGAAGGITGDIIAQASSDKKFSFGRMFLSGGLGALFGGAGSYLFKDFQNIIAKEGGEMLFGLLSGAFGSLLVANLAEGSGLAASTSKSGKNGKGDGKSKGKYSVTIGEPEWQDGESREMENKQETENNMENNLNGEDDYEIILE